MPLIPALRRQKQADLCEFEASLVYRASSRTVKTDTQRNPVSKNQKKKSGGGMLPKLGPILKLE